MGSYRIAVTGHRPPKLGGYGDNNPLRKKIRKAIFENINFLIQENNFLEKAYSGMALGIDQDFAEICIYLNIPVIAAIPLPNQASRWPAKARRKYEKILQKVDRIVPVYENLPHNSNYAECLKYRNKWMVNQLRPNSQDTLISVFDGSRSGTGHCVGYALSIGVREIRINPKDLRKELLND